MSKKVWKRIVAVLLVFALIWGGFGLSSYKPQKQKIAGIDLLCDWYDEYKINGSEESEIKDVDGIVREQATTYYLGSGVMYATKRSGGKLGGFYAVSIGYRAKRKSDGKKGFVTCAHGVKDSIDKYIYTTSGTKIGKIEKSVLNSTCDASFVSVLSGATISNKTNGKSAYVTVTSSVVTVKKGDKIAMCGMSSGLVGGKKVLDTSARGYVGGVYTTGMIKTEPMSKNGDSGAPVFKVVNGTVKLVGIIKGGDGVNMSYVIKAGTINSKLGITPY